jgi:hypothetical protein
MLVKRSEDLDIWKLNREMVSDVYKDFGKCKDYEFRNQKIKQRFQ